MTWMKVAAAVSAGLSSLWFHVAYSRCLGFKNLSIFLIEIFWGKIFILTKIGFL